MAVAARPPRRARASVAGGRGEGDRPRPRLCRAVRPGRGPGAGRRAGAGRGAGGRPERDRHRPGAAAAANGTAAGVHREGGSGRPRLGRARPRRGAAPDAPVAGHLRRRPARGGRAGGRCPERAARADPGDGTGAQLPDGLLLPGAAPGDLPPRRHLPRPHRARRVQPAHRDFRRRGRRGRLRDALYAAKWPADARRRDAGNDPRQPALSPRRAVGAVLGECGGGRRRRRHRPRHRLVAS